MRCGCGKTSFDRAVLGLLMRGGGEDDRIYHVGAHGRFLEWLREKTSNVVTSRFDERRRPGETENGIRFEDLTRLTFADQEFDSIICLEVLEHVPDYAAALREMARTLKPGGRALLSFPWLGSEYYEHLVRAEVLPDGSIRHIHPPEYHADTESPSSPGVLAFRAFGWKILDELRHAGFSRASAQFLFSPLHGYMTFSTPVIIGVR
jgi:SAM-dependent methyltransferase